MLTRQLKKLILKSNFPNLFSIENKIGEFQEKIISKFPDSQLVLRRHLLLDDRSVKKKLETNEEVSPSAITKIWIFKSQDDVEVRLQTNSLSIISKKHKTYNNDQEEKKFRDVIDFVVGGFLNTISLPIIKRIGLRYIDECPLPSNDNETLKRLYNSSFPSDRFSVKDVNESYLFVNTTRKNHKLIYQEGIIKNPQGKQVLMLDFDGFENNIASKDFLKITDELHEIINEEYFSIINEPVKKYMQTGSFE